MSFERIANSLLGRLKTALRAIGLLPRTKRAVAVTLALLGRRAGTRPIARWIRNLVEKAVFAEEEEIHDLPPIASYWANLHLIPRCQALGFDGVDDFYFEYVQASLAPAAASGKRTIASIGCGNGDLEIRLARRLKDAGREGFVIDCIDFNEAMLARLRRNATRAGVADVLNPVRSDFNIWTANTSYDVVIANQSLHHVTDLEHLLDEVRACLRPGGRFLSVDMIGRNGHARWPEALEIVNEYWARLPAAKVFNHATGQPEPVFVNRDASAWGFEGVRAQDILPLLIERFHFELFLAWGGVIDPFIDRSFGANYDPADPSDRAFIDEVARRNDVELLSGRVTPTQMFAVMCRSPVSTMRTWADLTPEKAVRRVA